MKTHEKIRLMRELKQWSQETVAEKLNLSTNGYAKIERGETKLNLPRLEQIATIFHVDLMDLLQPGDNGFICQINEGDNNNISFYDSPSNELFVEIEKLKLIISHQKELILHKDQMLQQKTDENVLLKELVSSLRSK